MRYIFFILLLFAVASCQQSKGELKTPTTSSDSVEKPSFVSHNRKDMTLLATGDLIGASYVEVAMQAYGKEYPFKEIRSTIEEADIAFANLECVISNHGKRRSNHKHKINYDATSLVFESLKMSGFDVFSLANNHVYDMGAEGIEGMIDLLTPSQFFFGGAGRTLEEASKPLYIMVNGLKIAFIFYFGNDGAFAATPKKAGYNYIDYRTMKKAKKVLSKDLSKIDEDVDITILSIHWGDNYTTKITEQQKKFAHYAVDQGVDLILGHSAHIFHAVELYKQRPILYDMGDIMINDDDNWDTRSFLFSIEVKNGTIREINLQPIYIVNSQIRKAHGLMADTIIDRFIHLEKEFNHPIIRDGEMLKMVVE